MIQGCLIQVLLKKICCLKKVENQPVELSFQPVDLVVKRIQLIVSSFQSVDFLKSLTKFCKSGLVYFNCFKTDLALALNVFNN